MVKLEQGPYQVRVDLARLEVGLSTHNRNPGKLLSRIPQKPGFVNYATLAQKAKVFDDRMRGTRPLGLASQGPVVVGVGGASGQSGVLAGCSLAGRDDWSNDQSNGQAGAFLKGRNSAVPRDPGSAHSETIESKRTL